MRNVFVKTSNVARFLAALGEVQERGAEEACLMVVDGEPGVSKTATVTWWATQHGSVYLRAKAEWTPTWMLRELLRSLRVQPQHSFERMYAQALEVLGARARQAERDDEAFSVIVDEVDHIVRSSKQLETLRDLSDMLEIPFILVGMGRVRAGLARHPQVASRVGRYVEFQRCSVDDTRKMVEGLCEVEVADDLVTFLAKAGDGLAREIKEGIASIERFGRRHQGAVDCAAMAGQVLLNDRRTGQPIKVKAT
jgi:DNA transposition AAA+ family ATPase